MITRNDVRSAVTETLTDWVEDYDVDGIVNELMGTYDLTGDQPETTVNDIDATEYWAIVERYDTTA